MKLMELRRKIVERLPGGVTTQALRPKNIAITGAALLSLHMTIEAGYGQVNGQATVHANGQANFLVLSAGTPPPLNNVNVGIINGGAGAFFQPQPGGSTNFTSAENLGELSSVSNGLPAQAILGLRVSGNTSYNLTVAQTYFSATNLQFRGVNVEGGQDRGSFVHITAGTPVGRGEFSNAQGSRINAALLGDGLTCAQISFGTATAMSTVIMSGAAPSVVPANMNSPAGLMMPELPMMSATAGMTPAAAATADMVNNSMLVAPLTGTRQSTSTNDGVEVPVYLSVPTGFALGPVNANSPGMFITNLQFAVFPQP